MLLLAFHAAAEAGADQAQAGRGGVDRAVVGSMHGPEQLAPILAPDHVRHVVARQLACTRALLGLPKTAHGGRSAWAPPQTAQPGHAQLRGYRLWPLQADAGQPAPAARLLRSRRGTAGVCPHGSAPTPSPSVHSVRDALRTSWRTDWASSAGQRAHFLLIHLG